MEINGVNSHVEDKKPSAALTSTDEENSTTEKDVKSLSFRNQAEIAWHERRREWIGDQSQKPRRVPKDSIISWSMTYDDLLSTNEPFPSQFP